MRRIETELEGALLLEPDVFTDERGFFLESYNQRVFRDLGITTEFIQDNYSFSRSKGCLRGLHFQSVPHAQTKLVWVVSGAVYDVIVDLRPGSPTRGRWISVELDSRIPRMLYVPRGFAHGFCTLTDGTMVLYKVDAHYAPDADGGIRWDDPDLNIPWPIKDPILSAKDRRLPYLRELPPEKAPA
ncbi:MAG: dTDP-4-dehydrorhamnose 3,5-epimerase [Desulfomonilia bacterium]|jgi:dTDP-4-dehydrorhamnose 3,5-epimerase